MENSSPGMRPRMDAFFLEGGGLEKKNNESKCKARARETQPLHYFRSEEAADAEVDGNTTE